MSKVVSLNGSVPSRAGEPRESLISALEGLLERARSGELQSLVGCGFTDDGMRMSIWVDAHENVYEMLGSIAWLESEYISRHKGEG